MIRGVFILTLLLILIFRQTSPVLFVRHELGNSAILLDTNILYYTPGLGWIEDRDSSYPKDIASGIETIHVEENSVTGAKAEGHFRFSFKYQPNPILIDLPPPSRRRIS